MEKLLKFTFHSDVEKLNVYLKMPSPIFAVLKKEIEMSLFQQRQVERKELRTYWIDEDGDEIDIVEQCDYEIFLSKYPKRQHLQVAYKKDKAEKPKVVNTEQTPPADHPSAFTIHDHVECDGCKVSPIVGFRYKCMQCQNFDLCERCEAKHKHDDHLMMRIPKGNGADAWFSSGSTWTNGRGSGRYRKHCPFANMAMPPNATSDDAPPEHHRHHRRSHRNSMGGRQSFFSQMYEMMNDLAEGGPPTARDQKEANKAKEEKKAKVAEEKEKKPKAADKEEPIKATAAAAAAHAAEAAQVAATAVAQVASAVAAQTASAAAAQATADISKSFDFTQNCLLKNKATQKSGDAVNVDNNPKTPPPTPIATPSNPILNESSTKSSQAGNDNNTTPVLDLSNIAQYIDPETMKTGIQILNNFSDMFAKMFDPSNGGNETTGCPVLNTRKSSMGSTNSSVINDDNTPSTSASSVRSNNTESNTAGEKQATNTEATKEDAVKEKTESDKSEIESIEDVGSDCESEQNENNRWQLLDKPSSSNSSPRQSPAANGGDINYTQLSKDLKAHVEAENMREIEIKRATENNAPVTTSTTATVASATSTTEPDSVDTSTAAVATPTATVDTPSAPTIEERNIPIVYHPNERINNSVHAMMSMGFSNDGAGLTQLLESVNGNISEALDIITACQRRPQ